MTAQADTGSSPEHRDKEREPVRIDARGSASRAAVAARRDETLHLDHQRPRPFQRRAHDAAWGVLVRTGKEGPSRIGDLSQAALRHLEDTDFLRGSEAVLRCAQQPKRRGPLPFQAQNRVDEMLERLGSRQRPILGYVADDYDRDAVPFGDLHQS